MITQPKKQAIIFREKRKRKNEKQTGENNILQSYSELRYDMRLAHNNNITKIEREREI